MIGVSGGIVGPTPGSNYYTIVISFLKLTNKCEEKLLILQAIGIIVIKSKETRVVTYTCRYSSGHLITNFSLHLFNIKHYTYAGARSLSK